MPKWDNRFPQRVRRGSSAGPSADVALKFSLVTLWLNGPFGVGKTAVARLVVERLPGARIIDPERIGYVMRRTLWRGIDYQGVALWRHLTVLRIRGAARKSPVVVPMTVVEPAVFDQVTAGARVMALVASREVIESRIGGSSEGQLWRRQNLDRCLEAFDGDDLGERIDTDGRGPAEVADMVLARL